VRDADAPIALLDRVTAGRDVQVSIFVGTSSYREISTAHNGILRVEQEGEKAAAAPASNPYKGLEFFDETDVDRFFGREKVIERLWQRCRDFTQEPHGNEPLRLLPIIGPSGCGKSSLVRAGLLPELVRRPLPCLGNSRVAILVPGSHPLDALSAILALMIEGKAAVAKQEEIIDALSRRGEDGAYHGLRRVVRFLTGEGRALVIVVDQFEEVWSLCSSTDERTAFVAGLLDVAGDRDTRVSVVLTLRSDFLGSTAGYPPLSQAISRRAFLVPSMTDAELRDAIAEPARRAGFPFDEATVELIVSQSEGREGALPLLQFALSRIWDGSKDGTPAAETLQRLGGVGGALAKEAERIYQVLPEADQRVVRRAFLAQVRLGEGTRDSRRRAPLEEIVAQGEDPAHVLEILRRFSQTGQRFITLGGDLSRGIVTAELCHEALLDHWDSLKKWIEEGRADLRLQRRAAEAAEEWETQRRPEGLLWRSPQLDLLREFHKHKAADMPRLQISFLEASERLQRHQRHWRYATLTTLFGLVLIIAVVFGRLDYKNWIENRPWAYLVSLSTGQKYELRHETANVGRPTEGVRAVVKTQVDLQKRRISRIHLGISKTNTIADWRSLYGTTVNAEWLEYAHDLQPDDGAIVTLSGLEALQYRTIIWKRWHYWRYLWTRDLSPLAVPEEPLPGGWAMLIDGRHHKVVPILWDEAFVVFRNDGIGLSNQPTSDALLAVRRRIFHAAEPLAGRKIDVLTFEGEEQAGANYFSVFSGAGPQVCVVKNDEQVLTLQPASTASQQNFSSWIKEGDYNRRQIAMPADTETAILLEDKGGPHELGELMFETEAGAFQIVPTDTTDVEKICEFRSR